MINFIKSKLTPFQKTKIKLFFINIYAFFRSNNLNKLARLYKTDKYGHHFYTPHYQNHFKKFKFRRINLLEIGVGGYDDPYIGGHSLRMWKSYFPFAKIFSLDIFDKSPLEERRIKIFKGSQVEEDFLEKVCNQIGKLDLIIDDGSHINEHVIKTFLYLFPKLEIGGYYVIEDTQTSYWEEEYGGSSTDFNRQDTIYGFFKAKIDSLNNEEFIIPGYEMNYFDKHIVAMHFYHNMIFIEKGLNNELSNLVRNNQFRNK